MESPAEVIASKTKAFNKSLNVATDCLRNKDYMNAHMMFGIIFSELQSKKFLIALNLNDLQLFSIHCCFAYSSVAVQNKCDDVLLILNSIPKNINLPLVNFLRASIHIANCRTLMAKDELKICRDLLQNGYNFKPNHILNEKFIPEINEDFMKMKLNGLTFVCNFLADKDNRGEEKLKFLENWMNLGELCEIDFIQIELKAKEPPVVSVKSKAKNATAKKDAASSPKKVSVSVGIQAVPSKANACNQTVIQKNDENKAYNKQLMDAVLDIKTKVNNNLQKKENDIKQLQQRNKELHEKFKAQQIACKMHVVTADYTKDRCSALEADLEKKQKKIEFLQKLLMQQVLHTYSVQNSFYNLLEEKSRFKICHLSEVKRFLTPVVNIRVDDLNEELRKYTTSLEQLQTEKLNFERNFRSINEVLLNDSAGMRIPWPKLPNFPREDNELVYKFVKDFVKAQELVFNGLWSTNDEISSQTSQSSSTYEDGRTTGSPSSSETNSIKSVKNNNSKKSKKSAASTSKAAADEKPQIPDKYQSEKELFEYVRSQFNEMEDMELLQVIFQIRDSNGGNLNNMSKDSLVKNIRKFKQMQSQDNWLDNKKPSKSWDNLHARPQWHSDESEIKCVICFDDYTSFDSHTLACGHVFHGTCIKNWLKRQSACPVCRVHIVDDRDYPPLHS